MLGVAALSALAAAVLRQPARRVPPAPAPSPSARAAAAAEAPAPADLRAVALRAPGSVTSSPELAHLSGWALRQRIRIDAAAEDAPVPAGSEVVRVALVPAAPEAARRLARLGVRTDGAGFTFDGRAYRNPDDAISVRDPGAPSETLVLGMSREAALRLAARGIFRRESGDPDYRVVSGGLAKTGRFAHPAAGGGTPAVDRSTDRDEIAERDRFVGSLATVEHGRVRWTFAEKDGPAVARLEAALARFARKTSRAALEVRVYPDPVTKARVTGSSRPADVSSRPEGVRLEVDASSPEKPDGVTPALAAAAYASEDPRLASRPTLLLALGARAFGRWWGRDVAGFAAFAARADVAPTPREVMATAEQTPRPRGDSDETAEVSPVLAVGCAASWLDAGIRAEGEPAVLALLAGPEKPLEQALTRWASAASSRGAVDPAKRRAIPAGFLRGVSYAMSNSIDGGYVSARSRETLERLARLQANSVAVMPFAFQGAAGQPALAFVHRSPQGETDEGTVRAITHARALGMTAMVKPQIWVGGEVFVGRIAMTSDAAWRSWFDLYRRFVVHHAVVAEAAGAALFCVGTELNGTEARADDWRRTIAAVRLATGAPLTYASNWVGGAVRVPFWADLDAIGVDFYDPPSADPEASDAALEAGVRAAARPLAALARSTGKPVVFTEAGFPLSRASWTAPHDENTGRPASSTDCARGIAAVYRALEREPWWRGVYWWKAFSSGREAPAGERGFNVLGGQAERAVAEGFARLVRERGR